MVKKPIFHKNTFFSKPHRYRFLVQCLEAEIWTRSTSIQYLKIHGTDFGNFAFFGNMSKIVDKIGKMSEILDITSPISKRNQKFKNLFHRFLDIAQRYHQTKFQLPSFLFEEKIRTGVILRKSSFCENSQNFNILVKIYQILIPIKSLSIKEIPEKFARYQPYYTVSPYGQILGKKSISQNKNRYMNDHSHESFLRQN